MSHTSIFGSDGHCSAVPGSAVEVQCSGSAAAGSVNTLPSHGNGSLVAVAGSGSSVPDTPPLEQG